jgi:hypothetical protein
VLGIIFDQKDTSWQFRRQAVIKAIHFASCSKPTSVWLSSLDVVPRANRSINCHARPRGNRSLDTRAYPELPGEPFDPTPVRHAWV